MPSSRCACYGVLHETRLRPAGTTSYGKLFDIFHNADRATDKSNKTVIVNFGDTPLDIVTTQIIGTLIRDALWAIPAAFIAMLMLRIGTGSWFLTIAGTLQVLVRFWPGWLICNEGLYRASGWGWPVAQISMAAAPALPASEHAKRVSSSTRSR